MTWTPLSLWPPCLATRIRLLQRPLTGMSLALHDRAYRAHIRPDERTGGDPFTIQLGR